MLITHSMLGSWLYPNEEWMMYVLYLWYMVDDLMMYGEMMYGV